MRVVALKDRRDKHVFTYSPYNSLHVAVTFIKNTQKKKRTDVSHPAVTMELSIYRQCDSWRIRTLLLLFSIPLWLCVQSLSWAADELLVSVRPHICSRIAVKAPFISIDGLHWHQPEFKSLPFSLTTETRTERDMLEVALKRVNVFVYKCVYWLNLLCTYWINVYIWYVYVYIQFVCICRVYSYFFPLMFLSLSMNRSSQVTNTEAWKGF